MILAIFERQCYTTVSVLRNIDLQDVAYVTYCGSEKSGIKAMQGAKYVQKFTVKQQEM